MGPRDHSIKIECFTPARTTSGNKTPATRSTARQIAAQTALIYPSLSDRDCRIAFSRVEIPSMSQSMTRGEIPSRRSGKPKIPITRAAQPRPRPADDALQFGTVFTDHMFQLDYTEGRGWHDPRVVPYQPFSIDPASAVLHYA